MVKRRILLADDEPDVLRLVKLRLEHAGFEVVTARNGTEALAAARAGVDVALVDYKMPHLDGLEVFAQLRAEPATARLPVILFTASSSDWPALMRRCIELGVTDWIKKPFRSRELLAKIQHALANGRPAAHG